MNQYPIRCAICILLLLVGATPAMSQNKWELLDTFKLEYPPIDMLTTKDNRYIYILTDKGQILIYKADGQFKDTIEVGQGIDGMTAGPTSDILYLLSRTSSSIQTVQISIVEEIDTGKAPFKGDASAPISVVVFSDFQ